MSEDKGKTVGETVDEAMGETMAAPSETDATSEEQGTPPGKDRKEKGRKGRKRLIVVGVIVAVIAVAGVGFAVWHEQPGFCNFICHNPMDKYVETYSSGDDSFQITAHAQADIACLDCHKTTLAEQIGEAQTWVSGDFKVSQRGYLVSDYSYDEGFCLNGTCHDVTFDELVAAGEGDAWNPHEFHHGAQACGSCHSMHDANSFYCAECHEEARSFADSIGWPYKK
jgi:hypothetical protein